MLQAVANVVKLVPSSSATALTLLSGTFSVMRTNAASSRLRMGFWRMEWMETPCFSQISPHWRVIPRLSRYFRRR